MPSENSPPLKPKLRWYQFSLLSLLIFVTVCGAACNWYVRYHNYSNAGKAYDKTLTQYDMGMKSPFDVCKASADYCQAGLSLPFADKAGTQALHVFRLRQLEERMRSLVPVTMYSSMEGRDQALADCDKIHDLRMAEEEKLKEMLGE
jgi:hypothetical protein